MPAGGTQPLRFSCTPCSAVLWAWLKRLIFIPRRGNEKRLLGAIVPFSPHLVSDHRIPCAVNKMEALHWASRPAIPGGPRRRVGRTANVIDPRESKRAVGTCRAAFFPVEVLASPRGTGLVLESDQITRGHIEQERAASEATGNHQNMKIRDIMSAEQPGICRTRSEAAWATPGLAVPTSSNEGDAASLVRGRRGRQRGSGRKSRAVSKGRGGDKSTPRNTRPGGDAPPSPAGRGGAKVVERTNLAERVEVARTKEKRKTEGRELVMGGGEEEERRPIQVKGEEPQ